MPVWYKISGVILTILMLAACQDRLSLEQIEQKIEQKKSNEKPNEKPNQGLPTDALKTIDQTLSGANKINSVKDIKFSTVPYIYELPNSMKEACHFDLARIDEQTEESQSFCTNIDIELVKIEPVWIEQSVNKKITDDDNPKLIKFKRNIDEFVAEHLSLINDVKKTAKENNEPFNYAPSYSWSLKPALKPSVNNVVQIELSGDVYTGGAHGMPSLEYLLFDMDLQTQIKFSDVIFVEQSEAFYQLAYTAFKDYLKKELELKNDKEVKEYEETWAFNLSENFYFDKTGVVLVYQPYEMGSYAQGFIELTIPYSQLSDILKGQYFPSSPSEQ